MNWLKARELARGRLVQKYDAAESETYDKFVGTLGAEDEAAYLADIQQVCLLSAGQSVLDAGAGTGALTQILANIRGLQLTALEPSPSMRELLMRKPELVDVKIVGSGCDGVQDRGVFSESTFDAVLCRQVVNSLFDPLEAFRNWLYWLKPGGQLVVIEGIYGRDGWRGIWEEEVDAIPLSACQSLATIPYLLEAVGFQVESVAWMQRTNLLPATRTKRYLVVATKAPDPCHP